MQPIRLIETNAARHDEVVSCTEEAIERLLAQSKTVSFYSVAQEAGVSRSTLYRRDDLRKLVENGRLRNADHARKAPSRAQLLKRIANLESDLERAKQEVAGARRSRPIALRNYACIQFGELA